MSLHAHYNLLLFFLQFIFDEYTQTHTHQAHSKQMEENDDKWKIEKSFDSVNIIHLFIFLFFLIGILKLV